MWYIIPSLLESTFKKNHGTIKLLKPNISHLFWICMQRKITCHGSDLETAGETAVLSTFSDLASKKTFLKDRQNVYGMFMGTDVYSNLQSCRISKREIKFGLFSLYVLKGKDKNFMWCDWFPQKGFVAELILLFSFWSEDLKLHESSGDPRWLLSSQVQVHSSPCPFEYELPSSVPWFPHSRLLNPWAGEEQLKIAGNLVFPPWLQGGFAAVRSLWAKTWMYCLL